MGFWIMTTYEDAIAILIPTIHSSSPDFGRIYFAADYLIREILKEHLSES